MVWHYLLSQGEVWQHCKVTGNIAALRVRSLNLAISNLLTTNYLFKNGTCTQRRLEVFFQRKCNGGEMSAVPKMFKVFLQYIEHDATFKTKTFKGS